MRRKLFWSILLACVTLVVTVTVTAEVAQQANTRNQVVQGLERQATAVAARLQEIGPGILRSQDAQDGVTDFLEGLAASTEFDLRIGFIGPVGLSFLDGSTGVLEDPNRAALESGETVEIRFRSAPRTETLIVAAPFEVGARTGVVVAQREIARWSWSALVATWRVPFLFAIAVSAVAAQLVARRFTRRLSRLTESVNELRAGNRTPAPTDGRDEVAELGTAFNAMSSDLEQARQRENDFLMDISHDLRTPLTTIVGYSEMLEASDDDATARIGSSLSRESNRLNRLVGDLMLLGRLRASQFAARSDRFELTGIVRAAADAFHARAQADGIELTVVGENVEVESDVERIEQIMTNLLDNALRHTPRGGAIRLSVDGGPTDVALTVADSGPGVPPERLTRLFDRLDAGPDRPAGSGLGLAIVRELTDLLGGSVTARNREPSGLAVTIRLPRHRPRS